MSKSKHRQMNRGIEMFADNVSARTLGLVFPNIPPVELLNGLLRAAGITSTEMQAKLASKQALRRNLPSILELMNNPQFVNNAEGLGYRFDSEAIFKAFCDVSGWKFSGDIIKKAGE